MSKLSSPVSRWNTSSFGHPADVSSLERAALGDHLSHCGALRGPLQAVHAGASALHDLMAGRVVTSVLLILLLVVGAWLMR